LIETIPGAWPDRFLGNAGTAVAAPDGETMSPATPEQYFGQILEVGEHCLIGRALPKCTDYVCTSIIAPPPDLPTELRRLDPLMAFRALRADAYGLVIAHAPAYAIWQIPILRALVRKPLGRGPVLVFRTLLPQLVLPHVPMVMLDLEDAPIVHPNNLRLLDRAALCFKRELPADRAHAFMQMRAPALPTETARKEIPLSMRMAKLRPISIGLSAPVLAGAPIQEVAKTVDIFFAGQVGGSATLRETGTRELMSLAGRSVRVDFVNHRLELGEFLKRAAEARMVWSPEGFGHECFRHYEAAACRSVPVINSPGIERHRPLLHGMHALYYAVEAGGLTRTVLYALRDRQRLHAMGRAGRRHVLRNHSHAALANYVLNETATTLNRNRPTADEH
jgi:hypothetical protein